MVEPHTPHVVVIGGGFGGLAAVRRLRRAPVRITIVDKRNHHLFQPLLYQVATASLAPSDIAEPIRGIVRRHRNVEVLLEEALDIDPVRRTVVTEHHEIPYDYLILAAGAESTWFGHDEWIPHAPGLKTLADALDVRQRLLRAFEEAEWCEDPVRQASLLTVVVIGGGPTGVELAGAIREIAMYTLVHDFRHIDASRLRVVLVEAAPTVLGTFPESLRDAALQQLRALGVEVWTGRPVEQVDAGGIVAGGQRIDAATVVWAAGVRASPLGKALGVPLDRGGRVIVESDLSIPGRREVFVVGDLAHVEIEPGRTVPGVAPAAIQMGRTAADAIRADLAGRERRAFRYVDKGSLATIGRSRAVAQLPLDVHLRGFVAWLIWVFVHVMTLVGFRNRLVVFVKWAWSWFTWDRSSRLMWSDERERDLRYDLHETSGRRIAQHAVEPQPPPPSVR